MQFFRATLQNAEHWVTCEGQALHSKGAMQVVNIVSWPEDIKKGKWLELGSLDLGGQCINCCAIIPPTHKGCDERWARNLFL